MVFLPPEMTTEKSHGAVRRARSAMNHCSLNEPGNTECVWIAGRQVVGYVVDVLAYEGLDAIVEATQKLLSRVHLERGSRGKREKAEGRKDGREEREESQRENERGANEKREKRARKKKTKTKTKTGAEEETREEKEMMNKETTTERQRDQEPERRRDGNRE